MMSRGRPRITLRMQLALLYAGFLTFGAALLLVPILTIHQSVPQGADGRVIAGIQASTNAQVIRSVAILAGLILLSLAAGWLIAGAFLRPRAPSPQPLGTSQRAT
jgi:hypothetical protein